MIKHAICSETGAWGANVHELTKHFLRDDDAMVESLEHANLSDQNQMVHW
jgi:hypothetical protein